MRRPASTVKRSASTVRFDSISISISIPFDETVELVLAMDLEAHQWLSVTLGHVCIGVGALFGYLGMGTLVWGAARALALVVRSTRRRDAYVEARVQLGKHLALSLEFLVAKDIVDSLVEPSWDELGKLAAIVVLRTAIQLALARELRELSEHAVPMSDPV
jgi:uncharacterized membrane protein